MIKVEKMKQGFKVEAKGSDATQFIGELLEASSSVFVEILRNDMTEAETDEFFEKYMHELRRETENKKERIKQNDPNLRTKVKKRMKMPWE